MAKKNNPKASISLFSLYHFWKKPLFLDIILVLLFALSLVFSIKLVGPNKSFDFSSFWNNLSASFLSIWITVRLINNLVSKRERLKTARQTFVNNIKHPIDYINRFYPRLDERDLAYLEKEYNWFTKKWGDRFYATILKNSEEEYARKLIGLNGELLNDVQHLILGQAVSFNNVEDKEKDLKSRLVRLNITMKKMESEIDNLVMEIWKTDRPVSL
jgi:hypothetical protein